MRSPSLPWFTECLACPDCRLDLLHSDTGYRCTCGFETQDSKPADFRPRLPQPRSLTFTPGTIAPRLLEGCTVDRPAITYKGPRALRDSGELFSAVENRLVKGGSLLDLGCGPRDQAIPSEHFGLRYVGVDFSSPAADLLADAHALPFRDGSFDLVFSYAVLEHLYNPFLAAHEINRVLKPGGVFFGTVSQGEPFHDSFMHHTAWGVLHVLSGSGFNVERLWPSYDTLKALSTMGRYPKAGKMLLKGVDWFLEASPMLSPRKYFRWSDREKEIDALHRAASICFVAERSPGSIMEPA